MVCTFKAGHQQLIYHNQTSSSAVCVAWVLVLPLKSINQFERSVAPEVIQVRVILSSETHTTLHLALPRLQQWFTVSIWGLLVGGNKLDAVISFYIVLFFKRQFGFQNIRGKQTNIITLIIHFHMEIIVFPRAHWLWVCVWYMLLS